MEQLDPAVVDHRLCQDAGRTWTTQTSQNSLPSLSAQVDLHGKSRLEKVEMDEWLRLGKTTRFCRSLVESEVFKHGISWIILLNVVELGTSTDYSEHSPWEEIWFVLDNFFVVVFMLEMLLKLVAYTPRGYLNNRSNVFDFLLAWVGVVDMWVLYVFSGEDQIARLAVLRVFRLLRLLRMVKVLSIQRQLVVVIEGIASSLSAMFWIGLLLAVIIYTFAIFCVLVIGRAENTHPNKEQLFGNIPRSMLSLFNITLLTEWPTIVWPLFDAQPYVVPFFVVFVIFASCGVLNVIIGVIVERTNQAGHKVREDDIRMYRLKQLEMARALAALMSELDHNGDEQLTFEELLSGLEVSSLPVLLQGLDLPTGFTLRHLFLLLDENSDDSLSYKEFCVGMRQLITSNEFQRHCTVQLCLSRIKREIKRTQRHVLREVREGHMQLMEEINRIQTHLGMAPATRRSFLRHGSMLSNQSLPSEATYLRAPVIGLNSESTQEIIKEMSLSPRVTRGSNATEKDHDREADVVKKLTSSAFRKSVNAMRHVVSGAGKESPRSASPKSRPRTKVQEDTMPSPVKASCVAAKQADGQHLSALVLNSKGDTPSCLGRTDTDKEYADAIFEHCNDLVRASPLDHFVAIGHLGPATSREPPA